jgi:hypothetical protein
MARRGAAGRWRGEVLARRGDAGGAARRLGSLTVSGELLVREND